MSLIEGFLELGATLTAREWMGFGRCTWLTDGFRELGAVLTAWKEKSSSPTSFLTSLHVLVNWIAPLYRWVGSSIG